MVLAAGRGSRLGDATRDRPKCLLRVAGRSLLDRQVAALRAAGARDVGVVTGWQADAFAGTGLARWHNPHWARTTMVDTLAQADAWLRSGTTLVSYGDIVYSAATARRLAACGADLAVAYDPNWLPLWRRRFADPLDDAESFAVDADGRLTDIGGRPTSPDQVQGQYMGLLRFTPAGWREACRARDDGPPPEHLTDLLARIVRAGRTEVAAVAAGEPWFEFDHPSDLRLGQEVVAALDAAERERDDT
ncbi:NTP transferase domain-containing protein [Krasilnikovia sp. MM14-A1259]|uniref:phosphocholine cytidylyltransferase family protein n=1 Tax=Krasilnikovia sp. MM14-A1259 TaxID=3373539 RepID=UPI00399C6D3B